MIIKSMMDTNGQIINSGSPIQNPPIAYDQQAQVLQEQFAQYGQSMPYDQQAQVVQEQFAQYGQSMPYDQQAQVVQEQFAQYGQSMPFDQQTQLVQEQLAQYGQSMPYDQQAQLVQEQFAQYGQSMPYDQQSQVALNQPVAYDQQGQVVQNQLVAYSQQVQVALNQPIIVSNIQGQQNNQSTGVNIYTDITLNAKASVNLNNIYNNVAFDTYQVQVFASNDDENITLSNGVNAIVYAGQGNDTLTFTGNQSDYFMSVNGANEVVVQNINNNQTVLTLTDANAGDILKFADTSITLQTVNGKIDSSSFVSTIVKGLNVSSIWEGSNGFWLTRYSKDLSQPFTLNYAITNKTTSDDDFNFNSTNSNALKSKTGTITFDANQSEKLVYVPIHDDAIPEDHEVFSFELTSTDSKVSIANSTVDLTIINDDFTAKSLDNLNETINAGDSSYAFTSDANSSSSNVIINNFTNNDNLTINGILLSNITVSSSNNDVTVTYPNHSITFTGVGTATDINSFNQLDKGHISVIPATISFASQNSDPTQPYQVQSISKDEGNSGTTTYSYNVVRTGIADALDIDYSIYLNSYNGVNQDDFVGLTPNPYNSNYLIGKLSFAQNEMSKTLDIVVNADTTPEFDENFSIYLEYYTINSTIYYNNSSHWYANGTIKNDDPYPIQIGFAKDANGNRQDIIQTEDNTKFTYHLTRTGSDTTTAIDLEYLIYPYYGGAQGTNTDDFNLSASNLTIDPNDSNILLGKVSFASGETAKDITVVVNNDNIAEFDEWFGINLVAPASNPTAVDQTAWYAHGTIQNDDPYPIQIGFASDSRNISQTEDNTKFTYHLTRTGSDTTTAVDLEYRIYVGSIYLTKDDFNLTASGLTIDPNNAYVLVGKVSFASGETSKDITIVVNNDNVAELDENFDIILISPASNPMAVDQTADWARGTIKNDDPYPIQIGFVKDANSDHQHIYQTEDNTNFVYHLTRTGSDTTTAVDLEYRIYVGSTDLTKDDFDLTASGLTVDPNAPNVLIGKVSFSSGEISKDITVVANNDNIAEYDEWFEINLVAPASNPTMIDQTAYYAHGTIQNNDPYPIQIGFATDANGNTQYIIQTEDNTNFVYHLTRTGSDTTTTVDLEYRVNLYSYWYDGTNKDDFDLIASGLIVDPNNPNYFLLGKVSFAQGETSKDITVVVNNDAVAEFDERFEIYLVAPASNPTALDQTASYANGIIKNDDLFPIEITVNPTSGLNQPENQTDFKYTLTRTGDTSPISINYINNIGFDVGIIDGYNLIPTYNNSTSSDDFASPSSGTIDFAQGEMTKDFIVKVKSDAVAEYDEHFGITLSTNPEDISKIKLVQSDLYGTIQNDTPFAINGLDTQKNMLLGTSAVDTITGGILDDYIKAGNGDDIIIGNKGADILYGESGNDTFKFNIGDSLATARDSIEDLSSGDKIDLTIFNFTPLTQNATIPVNAGVKSADSTLDVYIDSTNSRLVIESADNGTTITSDEIDLKNFIVNNLTLTADATGKIFTATPNNPAPFLNQQLEIASINLNPNQFNNNLNMTSSYLNKNESILGNLDKNYLA